MEAAARRPPRAWPLSSTTAAADSPEQSRHTVREGGALHVPGRHNSGVYAAGARTNGTVDRRADAKSWMEQHLNSNNGVDARSFPTRSLESGPIGGELRNEQSAAAAAAALPAPAAALQGREAARRTEARAAAATASAAAVAALAQARESGGWGGRETGAFSARSGQGGGVDGSQRRAGGEGRLRGLTSKLRHPLVDVRARAISNLSGKLSLGLLSPSDLAAESERAFFSDVVALLTEVESSCSSSSRESSADRSSVDGDGASLAGPVLNLCVQLAKDPSCRVLLAGQGAAVPLSRIVMVTAEPMSMLPASEGVDGGGGRGGGGELRSLAAEVLALVETSPGNRTISRTEEAVLVNTESPSSGTLFHRQPSAPRGEILEDQKGSAGRLEEEGKDDDNACVLYGDGSEPRWPLWTRELVNGPLLSAKDASASSLVTCLTVGWRFPHVRLVRSEESCLFDFEVRFRTADSPSGEAGLLRCLRHLRDEIIEDYPPEVLLQRPGSFGRLLSLLRTPSASERVLEEALSALSRLLERLIRSARLHRESAFLPPCSSSSSSRGGGDSDDQEEPFGDYRDGFSTTSRVCSSGEGLSPHAKAAEDSVRHWQERMPWHQQAALHQEEPQLGHRGSSPGEAAIATLLSFRYPQSGPYTAAGAATAADIYHESRHEAAAKALDLGVADGGLSVCGALFALFLSACPLLGSRGVTGKISTIKSNSGTNGAIGSTRAVGQRADGAGGNGRVEGAGVRVGPSVTPSRVAVLAGEVLKAVIPFLLEPPGEGQETHAFYAGVGGDISALSCDVDALRMQELLGSVGRVLGDAGAAGCGGEEAPDGRGGTEMPQPLESIALQLLLLISPADLVSGNHQQQDDRGSGRSENSGIATTHRGLTLARELTALLRHLVLDAGVAERRPSVRSRLRPYLAQADPEGAGMLQAAQNLTAQAESVLHSGGKDVHGLGRADGNGGSEERAVVGSGGGGGGWSWVQGALQKVEHALPLLHAVDEPRLVGVALTLWFSAADAAFSCSNGGGGRSSIEPGWTTGEARRAEGVAAKIVVRLVQGAFGERASAQAMDMLDSLTTADQVGAGALDRPKAPPSFVDAMIQQGFPDPRSRSAAAASRSRAALAVFLGGDTDGRHGETWGSKGRQSLPSPPTPPRNSLLFSAVLLRAAAETMASAPRSPTSSPVATEIIGSSWTADSAAAARRVVASSCTVIHEALRSDGDANSQSRRRSGNTGGVFTAEGGIATAAATAQALAPTLEAFLTLCCNTSNDKTPKASWPLHTAWEASTVAATGQLNDGGRTTSSDARSCAVGRSGGGREGDRESWRDAQHAVSSLLDFVYGYLETQEDGAGSREDDGPRASNGRLQMEQQRQQQQEWRQQQQEGQVGDDWSSAPSPSHDQQRQKGTMAMGINSVRRMWIEVRGLCGGRTEARAAASRRLAGLLKDPALSGSGGGGLSRGARDAPPPFLFLEDPILSSSGATPTAVASVATSKHSTKTAQLATEIQAEGRPLTFTAEHVRNLADVAGSPSLEAGLRRAAAEQLRTVLVSPGVAAAVALEAGKRGEHTNNICDGVLRAALSGLLPSRPLPHASSSGNQNEEPWPSPPRPFPFPAPASLSSATGREPGNRRDRGGFGDHQWDEAFLALLSAAVWEFADVRRSLLGVSAPRGGGGGGGNWFHTVEQQKGRPGSGVVAPAFEQDATLPRAAQTSASVPSRHDDSAASETGSEDTRAAIAVAAILRRLYHPRPSVRRLAALIAVRLAFDAPSFFSPLAGTSTSCCRMDCCRPGECPGSCDCGDDHNIDDDDHDDSFGALKDDGGGNFMAARNADTFVVPSMVLKAYPLLGEFAKASSNRRAGDQGEESGDACGCCCHSDCSSRRSSKVAPRNCSSQRHRFYPVRSFRHLVAREWSLLQNLRRRRQQSDQEPPNRHVVPVEPHYSFVAPRLAGELQGAGRRSEFAAAMLEARTWMLADSGYAEAFFGHAEVWQPAFERFLQAPPSGNKDRGAMRDVAAFLYAGTEYMCPRGFQVLADAAEDCFVPILMEKEDHGPTTVLGDYLGEWKTPSKRDSPRDLDSKRRLRESLLELLVAVVSSTRPGSEEAAESLVASSLPTVIWRDILEGGSGSAVVVGWSWWERGDAEEGGMPLTARRLAADFVTAVARRRGTSSAVIDAWKTLHVPLATTDSRDGGGGGSPNILAAAGWGDMPARSSGPGSAPLLAQIVRALASHASAHRSPDGFRGRASLVSSLVALQTLLLASSPPPLPISTSEEENDQAAKHVLSGLMSPPIFSLRGPSLAGSSDPIGVVAAAFDHGSGEGGMGRGRVVGIPGGDGGGDHGVGGRRRPGWVLRLACHRDATVRALSFGVLAETVVDEREGSAGEDEEEEEEEEAVRACVRAAVDGRYESPAVVIEALRFLRRHVAIRTTTTNRLPAYAANLTATLAKTTASTLTGVADGGGENAAGLLSVAAASLRFALAVVVAATDDVTGTVRRSAPQNQNTDGSGTENEEAQGKKEEDEEERGAQQRSGACHHHHHQQQQHNHGDHRHLWGVLEALWASGCLEACVHVIGVDARHVSTSGPSSPGWKNLLVASSPSRSPESTSALRSAQTAALALLRAVLSGTPRPSNSRQLLSSITASPDAGATPSDGKTPPPEKADSPDGSISPAGCGVTIEADSVAADARIAVRGALLRRTPLLAGLVRCLLGAATTTVDAEHIGRVGGGDFVVREACATLRCLLCSDVTSRGISVDGSGGHSEIPQAVFVALGEVLRWGGPREVEFDGGFSRLSGDGCGEAARTEAMLLLSVILAIPTWRCSLDLGCEEALSTTAILLREEAASLDRTASSATTAEVLPSADQLRRRCLIPLLESSERLRSLALSSGLIGDLCVALEALLGQMAVVDHGRETFRKASKHLETLKAKKSKRAGGANKPSSIAHLASTSPSDDSGDKRKTHVTRKPPVPTVNAKSSKAIEPSFSTEPSEAVSGGGRSAAQRSRKPLPTRTRARKTKNAPEKRNGVRSSPSPPPLSSSSVSPPPPALTSSRTRRMTSAGDQAAEAGAVLEREFLAVAALMVSTVGSFPEGQREALRLRLPQFLWKAWPIGLASQLAHGSNSPSHHHHDHRGDSSQADSPRRLGSVVASLLLQALLGLASCVANGFPEGKKAFVFAGPEGSSSPETSHGAEGGGEWPRSARSLLHRVAALALSSSPSTAGGGRTEGSASAGPYGRAATEAACEVVRSCALAPECRTVLSQSGFFNDAIAQISRLCAKALRIRPGTAAFTATVRRASHLEGVLVNSSLRADGQKALMQLDGAGDMLGDLVAVCLRATSPVATPSATSSPSTANSQLVMRTLLLLRNLALAPSTGQVAAHRESIIDLILLAIDRNAEGANAELARASASCLRAVLRGSSSDGGGKTAVGVGERGREVAVAVEACFLAVSEVAVSSPADELDGRDGVSSTAEMRLQRELLAVKALL